MKEDEANSFFMCVLEAIKSCLIQLANVLVTILKSSRPAKLFRRDFGKYFHGAFEFDPIIYISLIFLEIFTFSISLIFLEIINSTHDGFKSNKSMDLDFITPDCSYSRIIPR